MNLHHGAVQRYRLDLDAHDPGLLQLHEHPVEHTALAPVVHALIDRVPIAEALGQVAPLAALLGYPQDDIQNTVVGQTHVAPLRGQAMRDLFVLDSGNFRTRILTES
jgi:hypothetical protein